MTPTAVNRAKRKVDDLYGWKVSRVEFVRRVMEIVLEAIADIKAEEEREWRKKVELIHGQAKGRPRGGDGLE